MLCLHAAESVRRIRRGVLVDQTVMSRAKNDEVVGLISVCVRLRRVKAGAAGRGGVNVTYLTQQRVGLRVNESGGAPRERAYAA